MKYISFSALVIITISIMPVIALAQTDSSRSTIDTAGAKKDIVISDTVAIAKKADSASVIATPMNCYKQWLDAFAERGVKPVTDGTQEVVIAFKSKESCHCYMGKVEVVGGKIKAPVYVQTEGGDYKTFTAMGKKLDPEFIAVQGDGIYSVTGGMSVLFQTVEQEYVRIFFYKALNKNKQASKEAPSPSELLK
ncbi:MAG: hypothetical protein ACHQFX_07460 [Chitinophagales bacterium]